MVAVDEASRPKPIPQYPESGAGVSLTGPGRLLALLLLRTPGFTRTA
jgi:hypothetical protein